MDDLIMFLNARLDEAHVALLALRDGHPGPCLNYDGQRPEDYDEYDSCYRHIQAAKASPYRDASFGLADIDAKRRRLDQIAEAIAAGHDSYDLAAVLLPLEALPYTGHPDFQDAWRP